MLKHHYSEISIEVISLDDSDILTSSSNAFDGEDDEICVLWL